jgi:hypothetical protein
MSTELCECQLIKGQKCYERYGTWVDGVSFNGAVLPLWSELGEDIKLAWTMTSLGKSKVDESKVKGKTKAKGKSTEKEDH